MAGPEPIVFVGELTAPCSAEEVDRLLADPSTWGRWQPEIRYANGPSPLAAGDVAKGRARMMGFEVYGQSTALAVRAGHFAEDAVVGVHMRIHYDVEQREGNEVTIRHTLELERSGGVAGRVLTWLLKGRLKKMQREALRSLADVAARASR